MANKVVTYTDPDTTRMRGMELSFDNTGTLTSFIFNLRVASDGGANGMELGPRRMAGAMDTGNMPASSVTALATLLTDCIAKFRTDEGFDV